MKKSLLAISFVAILVACGTAKNSTAKVEALPSQADVDRVATKFPGYTLDELNEGQKLYEANCALCHSLRKPTSEPEAEWKTIVPRMVVKVNKKLGDTVVDASEEEKILRYVITMGSVPKS